MRNTDSRWQIQTFIRFQTKTPTVILLTWYSPIKTKVNHSPIYRKGLSTSPSQQVTLTCTIFMLRARPRNRTKSQRQVSPQVKSPRLGPRSFEPASQNCSTWWGKERENAFGKISSSCLRRPCSWDNSERGVRTLQKQFLTRMGQRHLPAKLSLYFHTPRACGSQGNLSLWNCSFWALTQNSLSLPASM